MFVKYRDRLLMVYNHFDLQIFYIFSNRKNSKSGKLTKVNFVSYINNVLPPYVQYKFIDNGFMG